MEPPRLAKEHGRYLCSDPRQHTVIPLTLAARHADLAPGLTCKSLYRYDGGDRDCTELHHLGTVLEPRRSCPTLAKVPRHSVELTCRGETHYSFMHDMCSRDFVMAITDL